MLQQTAALAAPMQEPSFEALVASSMDETAAAEASEELVTTPVEEAAAESASRESLNASRGPVTPEATSVESATAAVPAVAVKAAIQAPGRHTAATDSGEGGDRNSVRCDMSSVSVCRLHIVSHLSLCCRFLPVRIW